MNATTMPKTDRRQKKESAANRAKTARKTEVKAPRRRFSASDARGSSYLQEKYAAMGVTIIPMQEPGPETTMDAEEQMDEATRKKAAAARKKVEAARRKYEAARKELARALRGSLAWMNYSVDEYLDEKHKEVERENRS